MMKRWEAAKSLLVVGEVRPTLEQNYKYNERKRIFFWFLLLLAIMMTCVLVITWITYGISIVSKAPSQGGMMFTSAILTLLLGAVAIVPIKNKIGELTREGMSLYNKLLQKKYIRPRFGVHF